MDHQTLTDIVLRFKLADSEKGRHGYKRVLIQLFGFLGHGKSSFINSCKYVLDGGDYVNLAGADCSDQGQTTARISYPLTDDILLVDNRGCKTMNSYETGEIFAQLANLLPLDQEVEWSTGFRLVDRIVDAETEIQKSDFIFPVFLYSIKRGLNEEDYEDLKQLLDTANKLTGICPFVVLTYKSHGGILRIERKFQDMGVERVFTLENYTPEDHFKNRRTHEDVLKIFHEIIKEVQFKVEQAGDPVQEFKGRKQFVLKFIYDREMGNHWSEQDRKARGEQQIFLAQRMESMKLRAEGRRQEDRRYFEEEMKKMRQQIEEQLKDRQKKTKNNNCKSQ